MWNGSFGLQTLISILHSQDPFDAVEEKYRVPVPEREPLVRCLQHVNTEHFLTQLYNCIVLQLTVPQNPNDEAYVDNKDNPWVGTIGQYG